MYLTVFEKRFCRASALTKQRDTWGRQLRNQGASGEAILHSAYVFMANWGCYQHPCDLLASPLDAWEDIRDHHGSATGTASSGHLGGWLCHQKGRVPSAHAVHGGGLYMVQLHLGAASSFPMEQMGAAGEKKELFCSAVTREISEAICNCR